MDTNLYSVGSNLDMGIPSLKNKGCSFTCNQCSFLNTVSKGVWGTITYFGAYTTTAKKKGGRTQLQWQQMLCWKTSLGEIFVEKTYAAAKWEQYFYGTP